MSPTYESIEQAARGLTPREKAALAQVLIRDLDAGNDDNVDPLWLEEIERRSKAYDRGEMTSAPSQEVFARVSDRLDRSRR